MLVLRSTASAAAVRASAPSASAPLAAAVVAPVRTYVACAAASAARASSSIMGSASGVGESTALAGAAASRATRVGGAVALGGSQPARGMGIMDKLNGMIEGRKKDQMAKKRGACRQHPLSYCCHGAPPTRRRRHP
jgi:hypothetical protein